jgi:hypothetical protein
MEPFFDLSAAASRRQSPTPAKMTRPRTPTQTQLNTPPPTNPRLKVAPQCQEDDVSWRR